MTPYVEIPRLTFLSYDSVLQQYENVSGNIELTFARLVEIGGIVIFQCRFSVTTDKISNIAVRLDDYSTTRPVEAMDQFAGSAAVISATDAAYRIYPMFYTQVQADGTTRSYLTQAPGTFLSFSAAKDDVVHLACQWIV